MLLLNLKRIPRNNKMLNYICPNCKAAAKAPCLFRVKDGYQTKESAHIERVRLDYVMEIFQPKQEEGESDLDFVMRIDKAIQNLLSSPMIFKYADRHNYLDVASVAHIE